MQSITKTIEIRLPLTSAEQECISHLISMYPKIYNYVSKYIYKHKSTNQKTVMDEIYPKLEEKFSLSKNIAQSAIKAVMTEYKDRKRAEMKYKYIRFTKRDCYFNWGLDYILKENEFYICTINDKIKFQVNDYYKYFGLSLDTFFGPATIKKRIFFYSLVLPVTITDLDFEEKNRWKVNLIIWNMVRPVKNNLLSRL